MKGEKILMIPGPIEFTDEVLEAMGKRSLSHTAGPFLEIFGRALERMRQVFLAPSGHPFLLCGSGTLAMEAAVANLVEPGEKALVVNTGFFSDRFVAILERHGATVAQARASAPGDMPHTEQVEQALRAGGIKLMTITHVDTSTGVAADIKTLAALGARHGALVVVDGVCSVAGEELRQEEWGIDVVLTGSQKAIGVPPGLALLIVSQKALDAYRKRKHPVRNYYADWSQWLPIMDAYQARQPSYFATPAVNLVRALDVSLEQILAEGMEARWARHKRISDSFKAAMKALGLTQVPVRPELAAHTLTAPYFPERLDSRLITHILEAGAVVAGGLYPTIRTRYFRVGHMGAVDSNDLLAVVGAIEHALERSGYMFDHGAGLKAASAIAV